MSYFRAAVLTAVVALAVSPTLIRLGQRFDPRPNAPPRARLSNSIEIPPGPRMVSPDEVTVPHVVADVVHEPVFVRRQTTDEQPPQLLVVIDTHALRGPPRS